MTTTVPAKDLDKIIASGATILDVRTPAEHQEQRLSAAHDHVPLDQLNPADFMLRRGLDADAPVYLLCRGGVRAAKAADQFEAAGYKNMYVIGGGLTACDPAATTGSGAAAQACAVGGKRKMSIEEQVRFAAGALVLLGVFLGLVVKPVFFLLAFLTGAGLVYSGATGDCRMAALLMRAPWNKTSACTLPKTPDKPTAGGCA